MIFYLLLSLFLTAIGFLLILAGRGSYKNWDGVQKFSLALSPFMLKGWKEGRDNPFDQFNRLMFSFFWGGLGVLLFLVGGSILALLVEQIFTGGWW
ncbi:hypothetical protein ACWFMI_01830 [Nocardiopsis terrae]